MHMRAISSLIANFAVIVDQIVFQTGNSESAANRLWLMLKKSIRLDARLVSEAARIFGAKSRTEAVHLALREIVMLRRFKKLLKKYAGKSEFAGHGK